MSRTKTRSNLIEALGKLPGLDADKSKGLAARATVDSAKHGAFILSGGDLYYSTIDGTQARPIDGDGSRRGTARVQSRRQVYRLRA